MKIRDREIARGSGYVVAEAGTNHAHEDAEIRLWQALQLALEASIAGADAIKFQIFVPGEPLFCPVEGDERRRARWNNTCLSAAEWADVAEYAHSRGLAFIGSAFQPGAVDIVQEVCDAHKVAVRARDTYPWDKIESKPAIVSAAFSGAGDIPAKLETCMLYCIPEYPCPPEKVNFNAMNLTARDARVGYSDHCPGPWMSIKALALGAAIVEKHFLVFDRDKDPDGSHAATFEELRLICKAGNAWK